jgi:hypothetical protein
VFCASGVEDDFSGGIVKLFVGVMMLSWHCVVAMNVIFLSVGFFQCHAKQPYEKNLSFCAMFGNPKLAEKHGWKGHSWEPALLWIAIAISFMNFFVQM